jgi:hypothetical protein
MARLSNTLKLGAFRNLRTFGPIRNFALLEHKRAGDDSFYRYRLAYRDISLFIDCTIDKVGKISKFGLHD